jgi:hypothetical protein
MMFSIISFAMSASIVSMALIGSIMQKVPAMVTKLAPPINKSLATHYNACTFSFIKHLKNMYRIAVIGVSTIPTAHNNPLKSNAIKFEGVCMAVSWKLADSSTAIADESIAKNKVAEILPIFNYRNRILKFGEKPDFRRKLKLAISKRSLVKGLAG